MSFRIAQFNILGRHMAGSMWFHYARDFLPAGLAAGAPDWWRGAGFPRSLLWEERDGRGRFYRFPVLMAEIRALKADIICLVELDCFAEFRDTLGEEGYDAVFQARPGKADGCGIFWRRDLFAAAAPPSALVYQLPANDRIALAQPLQHLPSSRGLVVVSTHLHWDQQAGHQVSEAQELLGFLRDTEAAAGAQFAGSAVVCGDLNATPEGSAYALLRGRFGDSAPEPYAAGAFTSLKPDVYYYARPRGLQHDASAREEWHFQAGRHEVIDYILHDEGAFELTQAAKLPSVHLGTEAAERPGAPASAPYGFWAGGWAFAGSAADGLEEHRHNPEWQPPRAHGQLQLGIPNRLHGSDHIPLVCGLRFRGREEDPAARASSPRPPGAPTSVARRWQRGGGRGSRGSR